MPRCVGCMSTITDAIADCAARTPNALALSDAARDISYGDLQRAVASARARFAQRHGPVAVALDNGSAWAIADLALLACSRPCVPLPAFFSAQQTVHALRSASIELLVTNRPEQY